MNGDRRRIQWLAPRAGAVLAGLCLAVGPVTHGSENQQGLEGNPFRGRALYVEKQCVQCHAVWGHGGTLGPEIVRVVAGKSLPELAGSFWNHTPRMMEEMEGRGYAWPTIDRREMADILSYLYYVRLFDDPGDSTRGASNYTRLRCEQCHSLGGRGGDSGPPLDHFSAYTSPIPLAQAMWNAGPAMQEVQVRSGVPIPEFVGREMVDIQAFIREKGNRSEPTQLELLRLPDPIHGETLFRQKGCLTCHGSGRVGAPDLGLAALRMTVAEISGVLWNHSYTMLNRMRATGIPFPRWKDNELADVIAYLHLIGYRGIPGDPQRGADIFRDKGCAVCHEYQRVAAPNLSEQHAGDDAIGLSAAMWNHAPEMHEVMAEYGMPWPKFDEDDMENLVAYLRSLARAEARAK